MLLYGQDFGGNASLDQLELSMRLRVNQVLQTIVWTDFPIDTSAFVDSLVSFTNKSICQTLYVTKVELYVGGVDFVRKYGGIY